MPTSDAHHESELSPIEHAARHAHRARLSSDGTANAWPRERLLSWLDHAC